MENTKIGCTGIHHIALHASDFEASFRFYTEALGFKEFRRWHSGERTIALLEIASGEYIELFSHGNVRTCYQEQAGQFVHLALNVKDSKAAFDRAVSYGAKAKMEPTEMKLPSNPPVPVVISFIYGPDGEEIEFFEISKKLQ